MLGQPIDCMHQREFVNKTSTCSIIRSKYNAVMSYYEVIMRLLWVIPGYYGLFRVIMGFCRRPTEDQPFLTSLVKSF